MKHNLKLLVVLLFLITGGLGCAEFILLSKAEQDALNDILVILDTTIIEAQEKIKKKHDPTSPLGHFVETLSEKRKYIKKVESGEIPFDPYSISQVTDKTKEIQTNIKYPVDRIVEADVSFGLGQYKISDLSEEGKEELDDFVQDIFAILIQKQRELFPDKLLVVVIRTIGYADEIAPGSELAEAITMDMEEDMPQSPVELRQFLNTELSRRRSESVNEYVRMQVQANLNDPMVTIGKPEIIGMGENYPYSAERVYPPYQSEDKRRRICKIYSNVFLGE